MREGIHPNYYQATVTCNCGNTFVTGSTKEDIHVEKQILSSGSGFLDINSREYPLLLQLSVQYQLHITGSLKFLIDHIVHLTSGIYQRCSKNSQAASLPHISGSSEKPLRHMQSRRIKTTRQSSSAWRN